MRRLLAILVLGLCSVRFAPADAPSPAQGFVFSITEENDLFSLPSTDKHYTQGLHIALLWPDEEVFCLAKPLSWLPNFGINDAIHKYGVRIGQDMYTPINTDTSAPITTDRPYAGWLFAGLIREQRGTSVHGIPTFDHLEVDLGVIGPYSQAGNVQIWFHDLIREPQPNGWDNQLDNEPGLAIIADRRFLVWDSGDNSTLHLQLVPHAGFSLGNVKTALELGTQMRLGQNIRSEFAKTVSSEPGWFIFGGMDGQVVGYNEFLDGNMYHDSLSVTKEPVVLIARAGLVVTLPHIEMSYTYNYTYREFKSQDKYDTYGSLNLTYRF